MEWRASIHISLFIRIRTSLGSGSLAKPSVVAIISNIDIMTAEPMTDRDVASAIFLCSFELIRHEVSIPSRAPPLIKAQETQETDKCVK